MKKLFSTFFVLLAASGFAAAEYLDLDGYVDLVLKNNTDLQSINADIDSIEGKIAAVQRTYSYYLNAGASYSNDKSRRQTYNGAAVDDLKNVSYDVSINKQIMATGTQLSLGFNGSYNAVSLLNSGNGTQNDLAGPYISVQQSLLKDLKGGSVKPYLAKYVADAQSALYLLQYQKQSIIMNAKLAYWNLSYTRTVIDFRKTSLERSQKILEWNQRRYNLDLAEKTDMLQSRAAVKLGELNLKLAYENELKARRNFNLLLNNDGVDVNYDIEKFAENGAEYEKGKELSRKGMRADVLSALEKVKSAEYDMQYQQATNGSDLVLAGKLSLNGIDYEFGDAFDYVANASRPSYSLSLRYTLPLDFKLREKVNKGYESSKISAQKAAQAAIIAENNEWLNLLDNWENAKSRLALASEIRTVQQQSHEEQQSLLKKGRSTTYMVIQSEESLDDAELSVLQGIFELINIYEQAEAYYKDDNNEALLKTDF
jgi:outer membrane protein TolC